MHKKTDIANRPAQIDIKKGEGVSTNAPPPTGLPTESKKSGIAQPPIPPYEPLKKAGQD